MYSERKAVQFYLKSNAILKLHISSILPVIGEFRPQTDQRSDDSHLQHVKGETGRNRYKGVS